MLDILSVALHGLGYTFRRIDGSTATGDRQDIIDSFTADSSIDVMLLSTRAGGVGINLTAADTVVIHDCDWNPLSDAQAEDRAHRMGQTRQVTVYRLATPRSIEVHMAAVVAGKVDMANALMAMSEHRGGGGGGKGADGAKGGSKAAAGAKKGGRKGRDDHDD
jgi:SWI/SNF-related matrix-associated actin-dependent regulator 1 of chromatin subfamily A